VGSGVSLPAYGESNGHVFDDVTCPGLLFQNSLLTDMPLRETIKLLGNIEKTTNIIQKTTVYHTVNGDPALLHT